MKDKSKLSRLRLSVMLAEGTKAELVAVPYTVTLNRHDWCLEATTFSNPVGDGEFNHTRSFESYLD